MFRSKKDVDRHVSDIMSKIHNENERSLRGYNFARLYFQVKDHEAAKKHLQAYLSVRTHHAPSHKLLAQIYEATHDIEKALQSYKRSLEIDNKQKDIILKICELYCSLPVDHETARYWADRADQLFPHNDIVFRLRECLMTADGEPNRQELENLIYAELAAQPNNITLRMKLLKLYLDSERVKDAYEHAVKFEKKTPFPTSTEWYSMLVDIFEAYQDEFGQELDFSFYVQLLTALDHLVFLSLAEPHAVHFENERNGIQVASNSDTGIAARVLQQFDHHLKKAAEKDLTHGAWLYFFRHMKGQLYMHMGSLILKSAKKDQSKWKEACRFAAALFLVGYTFKPSNLLQEVWFLQMDEQQKLFTNFFHKGAMRTSFVGHVIISLCKEEEKSKWLQKIKRDVCLWQVRERIYNKLFCSTNGKGNVSNSYFLSDAAFVDSSLEFPQIPSLLEHDKSSYKLWPSSLHHLAWLHLHQKDMNVESFQSSLHELFKSLRFSNNNLSKGSPESLCMLDIEAYLLAVLYTTNLYLEQKIALGGYGSDFSLTVPPDIADPLCTTDQATWWHSVYGLVNNNFKERLGDHRRILQRGLEVIRGVGNHGLEVQLVVHLARAFADKAAALSQDSEILHHIENENKKVNSEKISALESRAVHYWNIALSMLRTLAANQTLRMPKDRMFNGYSKCLSTAEIIALNEEGKLYLACRLMNSEKLEEAIEVLEKLESPYASYYLALTFKKMALQESASGTRSALLHKARDALYTTMDRIKGDTTHTLNEDIYIEVEEIESEIGKHLNFANANISKDSSGADECDDFQTSYKATSKPATPLQIPKCLHSTPRPCSSFMTAKSKPDQSSSRTHLEPSPERLDAQIRALALTQSTLIKTLVEQQRSLLDTNKAIIEELKQNKDVVVELTRQLEELQLSTRKARHKMGPKKTIPKGQGEEDEEDYTDYETNGYLDYYVDDSIDNYQQNSYNHSRVVNDGAAASAMSYVPSAGLPAVPPPTIPYGYQYPPPTHHGIAPPPPHGAIPEGSHYYPAAINHGLPFSEGQPLPQFRFHVGSSMVKPPPVMNSIASIPQQNIPVVPPPGVTSISQAHSSPSWAKPGTPHAFQIPLPSTGVGSPMSQPPAVLSAPSPFVSSSSANQPPSSYIAASSTVTSTVQSANSDSYLKSILSSTTTPVAPQAVGQFAIVNSSPNSATSSAFSFANSGITNHTPEETRNNRSRQDSDVYSDADVEREVMGDFKPVIPLPEEVVVQTGEEDETVLFENRAKLFRFVDREWKERGTGSVKILKLEATGRVRLLMRRDQVHKVCANHRILPNMEITDLKGSDRALTWAAQDFADETVKLEQFCIRFKTADIAANFRKAFEDAVKYAKINEEKKNSPAISITSTSSNISSVQPIASQGFGGKGLPKPGSWNCPTCLVSNPGSKMSCMACETEKPGAVVKSVELPTNYNNNMPPLTVNSAKPVTTTPVTNLCNFSGKPFIYQTPVISVNETLPPKESHAFSGATPSSGDISDSSGLHATHQTPGAGIFGNFSFTSSDIVSESDSSIPPSQQTVTSSKGETTSTESKSEATSFNLSSSKFLSEKFQDNAFINSEVKPSGKPVSTFGGFTFISTPVVTEKTEETKDREILVVTTKSKDGPQVSKIDATKSPFTGFSFKGISDFTTKPDAKNSFSSNNQGDQPSKPIFAASSKFSDFSFSPFSGDISTNSFSSSSPLFVTVNKDGRRVSGELKKDNSKEVKGIAELQSSLNNIPSSEKDDKILFSEKVCLYCYDSANSDWKERDKGNLLLLHSKSSGKYRIIMQGDKTTMLSLNHCILPETKLLPLSSETTWMWEVQDYSTGFPKDEKFAAKFKTPAIAKEFYDLYEKCRSELVGTNSMRSGLKVDATSKSTSKPDANTNMELPSNISDPCSQNKTLFSDLFKPNPDSWECLNCYIRNEKNVKNCMACEYPKSATLSSSVEDKSSISWECSMCQSQNSEKETSCSHCSVTRKDSGGAKPLSEMYKPDPSSWECTACYVRNDKTLTKCQACETPKPGTLKTPAATPATHSVFGHFEIKSSGPFSSGFVFGSKDSLAKPTLQFGAFPNALSSTDFTPQLSTTSDGAGTVFGGKTVPSQPAGGSGDSAASGFAQSRPIPPVTAPPSFVFGRSQADSSSSIFSKSDSSQEPSVFPFGNSSLVSSGDTQTESSDSVEFRFGSPQKYEFHFGGVRPRSPSKCPKSPRSPGTPTDAEEEEEEAELSDADNIYFQPVIPLPPKVDVKTGEEDETVLFNKRAKLFRFSDGEWKERGIGDVKILYNSAQSTVRLLMRRDQVLKVCLNHYVTADTIFTWKSNKSLSWAAVDYSEHEASPEQFAIRFKVAETALQFEEMLDSALKLCKVSDGIKIGASPRPPFSESQSSTDAVKKRLDFSQSDTELVKQSEDKSAAKSYAEKLSSFSFSLDKAKSETSSTPFSLASRFETSTATKSGSDAVSNFFAKPSEKVVPVSPSQSDKDIEIIYNSVAIVSPEQIAAAKELMLPPTFYLYENKQPCPGCRGCEDDLIKEKESPYAKSVPQSVLKPDPVEVEEKSIEQEQQATSLFSNTSLSVFSFADLATENAGYDALKGNATSTKAAFPGAGAPVFGNTSHNDEEDGGDDAQGPDIHFEPVIPLPDIIEVKTGEEDEVQIFCNRGKLYRFDTETKQWKERGIGDLKILQHKEKCRFRILFRRDQVHKVACNHVITTGMKLSPMSTSESSLCWSAVDYTDGHPENSQFAVRFKNKDILEQFRSQFEACKGILSTQATEKRNDALQCAASEASVAKPVVTSAHTAAASVSTTSSSDNVSCQQPESPGEVDYDDDQDEEEDEDDIYSDNVSLEVLDETTMKYQHAGTGLLQVLYDDTVYGYRIIVTGDSVPFSGVTLCNHVIAVQTCLRVENLVATWAASDVSVKPTKRRQFRATFQSHESLHDFAKVFEDGKEIAVETEIIEKEDNIAFLPDTRK